MVSRAIIQEIREGRGIEGSDGTSYVHLDLTHLDAKIINEKLPEITGFARTYLGVEPTKEGVPIQPTAHYTMGGIPTDIDGQVMRNSTEKVTGFFAAGECACVSVHGANRLGTNSLLDLIVFGRRGGKAIVEFLKTAQLAPLPKDAGEYTKNMVADLKSHTGSEKCADIRTEMQDAMMDDVGIFRNGEGLNRTLKKLGELKERFKKVVIDDKGTQFNTDVLEAIELGNLLDTAYIVTACAENRKETRGGHAREDFPDRDDVNFLKHTMAYRAGDTIKIDYKPVAITKYKPKARVY
jgi:succinate dehydrogenase / fumarate reductase flavoprotein subunit